mmetsp:Transcript_10742/g.26607  ORF Transcript_10742/g.26607 Transcript_10742/m.26607 type:complete len:215 (-) Transcript_10742:775-1419(-)
MQPGEGRFQEADLRLGMNRPLCGRDDVPHHLSCEILLGLILLDKLLEGLDELSFRHNNRSHCPLLFRHFQQSSHRLGGDGLPAVGLCDVAEELVHLAHASVARLVKPLDLLVALANNLLGQVRHLGWLLALLELLGGGAGGGGVLAQGDVLVQDRHDGLCCVRCVHGITEARYEMLHRDHRRLLRALHDHDVPHRKRVLPPVLLRQQVHEEGEE